MAVDERERREMQEALVRPIESGQTDTLMHYLPPVGWADVATKQDLQSMETALRAEMGGMEGRLRAELHAALRTQFYWTITLMTLLMAGFVAALEFI